jgi:NTE family protein
VAGVAWELGVLRGLQDVNADLLAKVTAADVVVGTSAGSTVAVEIERTTCSAACGP